MIKPLISFCIPCYRSEQTITAVIDEIQILMRAKDDVYDYEIICVVDGSPDNVEGVLRDIATQNRKVKVITLAKNFGQANARMATLHYASGNYLVCLDDDGQCPMEHFWELFAPLLNGADVAIAAYPHKKQSLFKNIGSSINAYMVRFTLNVPSNFVMSNFFCCKKFIRDEILRCTNPFPYITGLLTQITTHFSYVKMDERDRIAGKTGYTLQKLLIHLLNGLTGFSIKPLQIASFFGIIWSIFGFLLAAEAIFRKFLFDDIQTGYTSIYAMILFTGGIIMIILGLIGEYVGRIFISINNIPQYVVKETINIANEFKQENR